MVLSMVSKITESAIYIYTVPLWQYVITIDSPTNGNPSLVTEPLQQTITEISSIFLQK